MTDQTFTWGSLGEAWWAENGLACHATEQQIKFAAARHQGTNKAKCAALAGYSGNAEALRSAGVRVAGSKAVSDLLTLAQAEDADADVDTLGAAEIDRKLTKLIRSPDGALSLKAIEAHAKREETRRTRGEAPEDDGFGHWRLARDFLMLPHGGGLAAAALLTAISGGTPAGWPLLHDVVAVLAREAPELWERFRQRGGDAARAELDRFLADPGHQLEARQKLWGEIGMVPPGPVDSFAIDAAKSGETPRSSGNGAEARADA